MRAVRDEGGTGTNGGGYFGARLSTKPLPDFGYHVVLGAQHINVMLLAYLKIGAVTFF